VSAPVTLQIVSFAVFAVVDASLPFALARRRQFGQDLRADQRLRIFSPASIGRERSSNDLRGLARPLRTRRSPHGAMSISKLPLSVSQRPAIAVLSVESAPDAGYAGADEERK